jgi:flagellar motor switch protein FliN
MSKPSVLETAEPELAAAPDEAAPPQAATEVAASPAQPAQPAQLPQLPQPSREIATPRAQPIVNENRLDLLRNVEMEVTAELGSTRMTVRELLSLTPGHIVELNRSAGSPVDLLVNGTLIARGEVVVVDEEFGIRISEIVNPGSGETT